MANQLCSSVVRWASNWPLLSRNPTWVCMTLFTSDTHQSRLHLQVRIGEAVVLLIRTPKILGVTLDTHFTFGPQARDCVKRVLRALNLMKALAGLSWGFTSEILVVTLRPLCAPSSNTTLPSGLPKFPYHIWINLRWFRTSLWWSRPVAIKWLQCPTSEPRLRSSPWGRTLNCGLSNSMAAPSNPCMYTPVT